VTHHGSPPPPSDDLLAPGSPVSASDAAVPEDRPDERSRTVTGVVVGARHSSARGFCAAAVVGETGCSATRPDGTRTW
jgi:hypothetical protein